jgi:hypothetical protein
MRINENRFELKPEVDESIKRGIQRGDAICEMELMGLSQRIINTLEESDYAIIYLDELVDCTIDQIATISNIGVSAIQQICGILIRYPKLEEMILNERKRES